MAATDPRVIIKNIVNTYLNTTPITKDDNVTAAYDLHLFERGPEDYKYLFFTEGVDALFLYGEARTKSMRPIQDVPVHFIMSYPITVVTVDKRSPPLGALVCTGAIIQMKARDALRVAIANSAQTAAGAVPAYTLMIQSEVGSNQWSAGINVWSTVFIVDYTFG